MTPALAPRQPLKPIVHPAPSARALAARPAGRSAKVPGGKVAYLDLPRLRRDQWEIARHPAKVKILAMGRRWGKSVLGSCLALTTALAGGKVAWCVPAYRNGRPLWRAAMAAVAGLRKRRLVRVNETERIITFPSGGFLCIYSMDNPDCIRGEHFDLVILDEAASMRADAWSEAIEPTLADLDGDAVVIGTPKGRNWFFELWTKGQGDQTGRYKSWTAPTRNNPNPRIKAAADRAKVSLPAPKYLQEWEAQFLEGEGLVFRRVTERAIAPAGVKPYVGQFVAGVDWGRSVDYTVITVIDIRTRAVVDIDRFNGIGWELQRGRLVAMILKWSLLTVLAEANSIGQPNIEALQSEGWPVQGWTATNATKAAMIEQLTLDIENGAITYPNDPVLVGELQSYAMETLPSGLIRYSAPEGLHDDTVISLGLANLAAITPLPGMAAGQAREFESRLSSGLPRITGGLRTGV